MSHYESELDWFLDIERTPEFTRKRLDEILVAAKFHPEALKERDVYNIPGIKFSVDILTNDDVFRENVIRVINEEVVAARKVVREKQGRISRGLTDKELEALIGWRVLRELSGEDTYDAVAKLFKVPKGIDLACLNAPA